MAEKCTKTSSPDWRLMKPNPFASLNHFTVPCSIGTTFFYFEISAEKNPAGEEVTLIAGPAVNCGESDLADRDWMSDRGDRIHLDGISFASKPCEISHQRAEKRVHLL
jgi:hypothetical protein